MIKKNKGTLILTSLLIFVPSLIGLILWNRLPDAMPCHWNIRGEVDGWCGKAFAVFGLPAMMLVFNWICVFACLLDPKGVNYHKKTFKLVLWLCPILCLVNTTMVYCAALGYELNSPRIMCLVMGLLFVIIGNLLPKCPQTYTLGIKLPWTLNSEENWNKTHRFGGKVWVIGGVLIMLLAFWGNFWVFMGITLLMVLLPTVYSYRYYAKYEKKETDHES